MIFRHLSLQLTGVLIVMSAAAQLTYIESFRQDTAPGWEFEQDSSGTSPRPRLTANAVPNTADPEFGAPEIDVSGNGWLRLATTTGNQANAVALDTALPSANNTIRVGFDFAFWKPGNNPADGITVFLWDAGEAFDPGAFGGSLGYAQRTGVDGLAGAYVGVGLDTFGNFANGNEGRQGNITSLVPNSVVVRGSGDGQTGYNFLDGTTTATSGSASTTLPTLIGDSSFSMDFPNSPTRPDQDAEDFRRFEMELDENDRLTVWMQNGFDGSLVEILSDVDIGGTRPDQLRIGFSGATGGLNEVFEIRNLEISTTGGTNSFYWDDENGNELWGTGENWDQDTVPTDHSFVVFSDAFPDTKVDQTVNVGADRIISSATFSGESEYTLNNNRLIFDTDGNGKGYLNVLNSQNGNSDHTINSQIQVGQTGSENDLDIQNLVNQTLTLNGSIDVRTNDLRFDTAGVTDVNGVISGSGDLSVDGAGTTIFSGNNTYTGSTTVLDGRLQINNDNGLGNPGNDTAVDSGASLALSGGITTPTGESLSIDGAGNESTGALTNTSGSNTFQGAVTAAGDSTIGSESGTLNVTGNVNGAGNALDLYADSGATARISGVLSGTGTTLTKTGAGTGTLSGNNTYTGVTTVQEGTLRIQNNGALGDAAGDTVINSGATLEFINGITIGGAESYTASGTGVSGKAALWAENGANEINGALNLTGGTTSVGAASSASLAIDGGIAGAGQNIIITGGGAVIYASPQSTQSGSTTITSGATLQYRDAGNRINDSSAVTINSGATFDMNNAGYDDTIGSLAGGGTLRTRGATMTAGGDNTTTTFSGSIQDAGSFSKEGTGTMTFTGTNTFTGTLSVDGGTVAIGAANVFADNMDVDLGGGTLSTDGFADTLGDFNLSSNSTIDFMGATGGFLTFDSMSRTGGTLTIDNWAGNLNGNGNTRLQVTDTTVFGSGTPTPGNPVSLSNITFTGFGGAELIDLGSGLFEVVPELSGWFEWDGSSSDFWNNNNNWTVDGMTPNNFPDATDAQVLVDGRDSQLTTRGIDTGTSGGPWDLRDMVINNDVGFEINGTNALLFNATDNNDDVTLTVVGSSSPTFNVEVQAFEPFVIRNNSTGTLTFNDNINIRDASLSQALLTFDGSGLTVVNGDIEDNTSDTVLVTKDGTGTIRLNGDNSEVTGGFVLNDGTVQIGNDDALGNATGANAITINGGTLAANGGARDISENYTVNDDFTIGNADNSNLTMSGAGVLANDTALTVESGVTGFLSGNITGNNQLTKEGDGTLSLTGDNSFDGLVVNDGTVSSSVGNSVTVGGTGPGGFDPIYGDGDVDVNAGGSINLTTGANVEIGDGATLTNSGGTTSITAGGNLVFDGDFAQSGGATTFDAGGNITTDGTSELNVSGGTTDFTGDSDFTTSNAGSQISVSNGAAINVDLTNGTGDFTLSQNDFLNVDGSGTAFTVSTAGSGETNLNGEITLSNNGQMTVAQGPTVFGANAIFDGSDAASAGTIEVRDDLTFTAGMAIANAPNITLNIASGSSQITAAAANTNIENLGVITKTGDGDTTIGSNLNNLQASKILITGGSLINSTSNQIENNTALEFSGSATGMAWNVNDSDEVLGTLTLSNTSTVNLDLGSSAGDGSIVRFADSSSETWTSSGEFVINDWNGSTGGGGTDQIFFGSDDSGLDPTQLGRIQFFNPAGFAPGTYDAEILATGEIVPTQPVPEPGTYLAGGLLLGTLAAFEWRRRNGKAGNKDPRR